MSRSLHLPSDRKPKPPVFSIEECTNCGLKTKRPFQLGDYVYKLGGECTRCHNKNRISMIFAEPVKQ